MQEHRSDRHRVTDLDVDRHDHPFTRRDDLGLGFVGRELDDGVVLADALSHRDEELRHGPLGDFQPELWHGHGNNDGLTVTRLYLLPQALMAAMVCPYGTSDCRAPGRALLHHGADPRLRDARR